MYLGEKSGKYYPEKRQRDNNSVVDGTDGLRWTYAWATPSVPSL